MQTPQFSKAHEAKIIRTLVAIALATALSVAAATQSRAGTAVITSTVRGTIEEVICDAKATWFDERLGLQVVIRNARLSDGKNAVAARPEMVVISDEDCDDA